MKTRIEAGISTDTGTGTDNGTVALASASRPGGTRILESLQKRLGQRLHTEGVSRRLMRRFFDPASSKGPLAPACQRPLDALIASDAAPIEARRWVRPRPREPLCTDRIWCHSLHRRWHEVCATSEPCPVLKLTSNPSPPTGSTTCFRGSASAYRAPYHV